MLRYVAAAPVFAAIAALQWPGVLRRVAATVLVAVCGVVLWPHLQGPTDEERRETILLEIGTTARPWVTEVHGLEGLAPRATGSDYLWTDYVVEDDPTPVVSLLRMPDANAMGGDPCQGMLHIPEGTFQATTCQTGDGVTWERTSEDSWRQVVRASTGPGSARRPAPTCRSASSRGRPGMRGR